MRRPPKRPSTSSRALVHPSNRPKLKTTTDAEAQDVPLIAARQEFAKKPAAPRTGASSNGAAKRDRNRGHEPWRKVGIPTSRDVRALRPPSLPRGQRFETPRDVAKVNTDTITKLSILLPDVAAAMECCEGETSPCSLPCCAICARRFRGYHTSELLRIADMFEGPHEVATIYLDADRRGLPVGCEHQAGAFQAPQVPGARRVRRRDPGRRHGSQLDGDGPALDCARPCACYRRSS